MAIQSALFSKVLRDRSLEEAVDLTAEIGYDGFEPMCRAPHLAVDRSTDEVADLRERLDDHDLDVPCLATYTGAYVGTSRSECEAQVEALERFLEFATLLDCDFVRHNPGGPAPWKATDQDVETAATWYQRAADRAAAHGVTLLIEIHARWLSETISGTEQLLSAIDRDNVGVIHDAGNMFLVGEAYGAESVDRLGDDLRHVHVKDEQLIADGDNRGNGNENENENEDGDGDGDAHGAFRLETADGLRTYRPRRLGEGEVDHAPLFEALVAAEYDGFVTAECSVPQDEPADDDAIATHELEQLTTLIDNAN
ncbi:sugar phosphate isomerase/epimerase family protein [Natronosalvus halobius]|uniref:sugar phosphate isomerase/epimerase family protein n=1 Tax=Natronosalvus halobius TaxID=2953746 RepID=UPI00209DC136|nr:sugar phosphate isomerase/epimerase family protein [Natronosalvus halobius]USZ72424.1 sugar phosphate isomerase/epimerase [Natronosalvus halobius]